MILNTKNLNPATLSENHTLWVYNSLDSAVTFEVWEKIHPELDEISRIPYHQSLCLQSPILDMMRRGLRVDMAQRAEMIQALEKDADWVQSRLDELAITIWGRPLNPQSPKQMKEFMYGILKLPEQFKHAKGVRTVSCNRPSLEKLADRYFVAQPIVSHVLEIRELRDLAATLRSTVDPDGRMRTSINISGTETGRFSSSESAFGTGTNLQNQTERLRRIFVADPGCKLAYIDLEQAESRAVGIKCAILGLGTAYLEACSAGDLHTTVTKMVWPQLPWTGDLSKDKALAETPFYRHYSHRDMSKRGGHGSNYFGQPPTMAKHLKIDVRLMAEFQAAYFEAFPEIPLWHKWVVGELQGTGQLVSMMGRRRQFWGRRSDEGTWREAIAYDPQSSIGDYMHQGLIKIFNSPLKCEVLLDVHDALLIQYKQEHEEEVVPQARALISSTCLGNKKHFINIPTDVKTGWNWSVYDPKTNPFGLKKFKGHDDRKFEEVKLLDRVLR
jgi:DNA polymerase-1